MLGSATDTWRPASLGAHSKISVLLSDDEYEIFDAYCRQRGYKKSTLIARLIREHLRSERFTLQSRLPLPKQEEME